MSHNGGSMARAQNRKVRKCTFKKFKKNTIVLETDELIDKWKLIRKVRRQVNTAIEQVRNKTNWSSLEAEIFIYIENTNLRSILNSVEMKKIMMVAQFYF